MARAPGVGPGGAQGADGNGGDSDNSSRSSSGTATDPLDTNSDGTAPARELAAGQAKAVMQKLLAVADSDGNQQISSGEAKCFGEVLRQLAAGAAAAAGATAASGTSADSPADLPTRADRSDRQSRRADNPGFADRVLRHNARASANADITSRFSASDGGGG